MYIWSLVAVRTFMERVRELIQYRMSPAAMPRDDMMLSKFRVFASLLCALFCTTLSAQGYSLRFYGNDGSDSNRVKILIDEIANAESGPPIDVGATDFTIEFWMRASAADNPQPAVTCGPGYHWIWGNIIIDRDRYNQTRSYGISVANGRLTFGILTESDFGYTICGTSVVVDDQWHHVAVQRRFSDGWLSMYVDGVLEAQVDGPDGDISYPDDGIPGDFCAGGTSCDFSDPYLVFGAEKHDVAEDYNGYLDEVRYSTVLRYTANFTPPGMPFVADASTVGLYHFDENGGDTIVDSATVAGGPTHGIRRFGGSPAGPVWSTLTPFAGVLGDVNGDGVVDSRDLGAMMNAWGDPGGSADLNQDALVDALDLDLLLRAFE